MRDQRDRDRTAGGVRVIHPKLSIVPDEQPADHRGSGGGLTLKEKSQMSVSYAMIEAQEIKRNRPRDVAALHALQAARPLKPPPYNFGPARGRAALLAVREDRKAGVLV